MTTAQSLGSPPNQTQILSPADDELEELVADLPGFAPLPPPRPPDPLDPETTTIRETPEPSDDGESSAPFDDEERRSSSTRPSGPSPASTADPELVADVARQLVALGSLGVRFVRERRRGDLPPGVWLADDDDQAAIGDPLARIAARRLPDGTAVASPDVADGIEAMLGGVAYVTKHAQLEAYYAGAPLEGEAGVDDVADAQQYQP